MSKTGRWSAVRCSAGQSQSTRQGQVGHKLAALNLAAQVRAGQRGSVRITPAAVYPQQTDHENMSNFYKNSLTRTHTHCLFGQWNKLRTSIVSVQCFLFRKREISCPGTCAVSLFYHTTCIGAHDFSHGPPLTGSCPPCATPIKKILESPLICMHYCKGKFRVGVGVHINKTQSNR